MLYRDPRTGDELTQLIAVMAIQVILQWQCVAFTNDKIYRIQNSGATVLGLDKITTNYGG